MAKKDFPPKGTVSWFKKNGSRLIGFILVTAIFFLFPSQNIYYTLPTPGTPLVNRVPFALPTPPPYPVNLTGVLPDPLSAEGVVVVDVESGALMYKKNPDAKLAPASTTKMMTALVAIDSYHLDDIVTVKTVITDGRVMGLIPGEKITVEALLYGALVHSANDAAYALAENYPGGVDKFVAAMNERAQKIFLTNTHFINPIGFADPNHYSTAYDLARLAAYALKNKTFAKIVSIRQITVSDTSFTYFHNLSNVNELLGKISGVGGVKSGYTDEAGECLVTMITRNGEKVIIVVLRSQDRFGETEKLINWIFTNFKWESIFNPDLSTPTPVSTNSATLSASPVKK